MKHVEGLSEGEIHWAHRSPPRHDPPGARRAGAAALRSAAAARVEARHNQPEIEGLLHDEPSLWGDPGGAREARLRGFEDDP